MQIVITAKHITLDDQMKEKIESKFARLEHIINNDGARMEIEVVKDTGEHHHKGKIFDIVARLHYNDIVYKAAFQGESIVSACEVVKEELQRQIVKIKEKRQANKRKTRNAIRAMRGKI